ncbi:hypothetical protein ACFLT8_02645 [Chloroflexota bacterium]
MRLFRILRAYTGRESGISLVETVVALAILGAIAVAFLDGLSTSSRVVFIADEGITAKSLAQSQMEWVKNASYNATGYYYPRPIPSSTDYINYSANINAEPLDAGLQKITVTVKHSEEVMIRLEGYKVDR